MTLRFGTDGVRGVAGTELTPELVLALGRAAARALAGPGSAGCEPGAAALPASQPRRCEPGAAALPASQPPAEPEPAEPEPRRALVVGRDTRWSGPMLSAALAAGLTAEGVDVIDVGVLPTPAVAAVAAAYGVPAAVLSASHNPFPDNGVKLFAAGGLKLSRAVEEAIEVDLRRAAGTALDGRRLGGIRPDPGARSWYCRHVVAALEGRTLGGLRVVLDCGHGAAVTTAAEVLAAAGADVVAVRNAEPDGTNINRGGATDPSGLVAEVVASRADMGLAFDGDADRVIAVDGSGEVVDGDRLLALFASDLAARGRLAGRTVVVTVMTNLGFHQAMGGAGIAVHQTPVGDRHVLEALDGHGWSLGGEQSGHLIFRDMATTGDGVLSGLLLADLVVRGGVPLADQAAGAMVRLPQVLRNVVVADRDALEAAGPVWAEVRAAQAELGPDGRVLLRPSGTERLVRVMVEAPTEAVAVDLADRLVAVVTATLGAPA